MDVKYKFRKESIFMKKNDSNKSEKSFSSSSINWYGTPYDKTVTNLYFIREFN